MIGPILYSASIYQAKVTMQTDTNLWHQLYADAYLQSW